LYLGTEETQLSDEKVTLSYPGGTAEFPILSATDGSQAVDISKFHAATGLNTLDQGFVNTASTKSAITFIDGDQGILRYRGYPIEQLAAKSTFLEVAYLLIYGNMPTESELNAFDERIRRHTLIHEDLKNLFHAMPTNAHPMSVLSSGVSALSTRTRSTRTTTSRLSFRPFDC
jgi:citrate synthase